MTTIFIKICIHIDRQLSHGEWSFCNARRSLRVIMYVELGKIMSYIIKVATC